MKRFLILFLAVLMVFAAMPVGLAEENNASEPVGIPVVEQIVELGSPDSTAILTEEITPESAEKFTTEPTEISTEENLIDQDPFEAGFAYSLRAADTIEIVAHPENVSAKTGASVSFSVSAQGSNLSYQWQTLVVGETAWVNTGLAGNKTAKLSFTAGSTLDGRQYRCAVSDGIKTVYSNPATLTLTDVLKITANPASVSAKTGETISFTVFAKGSNLSYQWQTFEVGTTDWVNTGMTGNQTKTLCFTAGSALDGCQYRCAVSDGIKTVYSDPTTLTLTDVLKITAHPASVSAKTGNTVTFTVSARGSNLSYQWQTLVAGTANWVNTGMSGNKTAKITFTTTAALDGRQYRCAVSDGIKTVYSDPATLTLTDVLKITAHPTSVSAKTGAPVAFTVSAKGSNLSYQWQTLAVRSTNWVNTGMSGNKTARITFTTAAALDGRQYRCAVSDGIKTVYSDPATLTLTDVLKITAHPANVSAKTSETVTFTVSAKGSNLSYQWQTLVVGTTNWVNTGMAGNKTGKITFTTTAALDGRQYRCAVSDGIKTVYSDPATLTLTDVLKITAHPANVSAKTSETVTFTVSAKGSNLSYQWQTLVVGTTDWVDTGLAGNKTAKLSFTAGATLDGRQYRCTVSDGVKTVYSDPATLTLTDAINITSHPANVIAKTGDTVTFTVSARGSNLSYQWQTREEGETTWVNTGMSGKKTIKISFTADATLDGRQYRCAVSNCSKIVYTNPATLTLTDVLAIVKNPENVSAKIGNTVTFVVSAKGSNLSYQWQTLVVGTTDWVNTGLAGNKTVKLSFTAGATLDGRQYRCAVSDGSKTVYSDPATLTLTDAIDITLHPADVSAKTGNTVTFTVSAKGSNLSYQWQTLEVGKTKWVNTGLAGNKTEKLSFTAGATLDGRQYRCAVSDGSKTVYSNPATLTLTDVTSGKETIEMYDAHGNYIGMKVSYTDADGKDIQEKYDAQGKLTSKYVRDVDGKETQEYYDAQGKLTSKHVSYTDANGKRIQENYDAQGNYTGKLVLLYKDAEGKETTEVYDAQGKLTSKYVSYTDANGKRIQENYDMQGNYTGRYVSYIGADGKDIEERYNAKGMLIIKYTTDTNGKRTQENYDTQGKLTSKHVFYTDADGKLIQENYDDKGNYTGKWVSADGINIDEEYDAQGNLEYKYVYYTDADGKDIKEQYNAQSNLTYKYTTDADGKTTTEAFYYDVKGNYIRKSVFYTDGDGKKVEESYDAQGNYTGKFVSYIDANGKETWESYDAKGDLIEKGVIDAD